MREVNEFVINFIGWMIVCVIVGTIHLELFKYNDGILYWVSKIMFFSGSYRWPSSMHYKSVRKGDKNEKSEAMGYYPNQRS